MIRKPTVLIVIFNESSHLWLLLVILLLLGCLSLAKSTQSLQHLEASVSGSDEDELKDRVETEAGAVLKAVDTDGDGLSDFQEIHKYLTDPAKRDTDGDNLPDGDWNERREYSYSVRSILKFMLPFDRAALNDDFQDARVLEERDDYVEMEVIHYPLGTAGKSIIANPNWQKDYAGMTQYLKPGVTTNWDAKMREDLLEELKADEIIIDNLTDKQVVEKVASWLMKKSRSLDKVFTTYYIHYPEGKPNIYPGLENVFEHEFNRDKDNYNWTIKEHYEHELLGRGMFYNKTHGSCTSFAVYLTTVLRAVGIPTRMIIVIPLIDPSNKEQLLLVRERISHNEVRERILARIQNSSHGFVAHTFNEVYVGKRWCRLNYNELVQSGRRPFGLPTHLYTFCDLSEVELAPTWGLRYGKNKKSVVFKYDNPYSVVTLSDLFGSHSNIPNPPTTVQYKSSRSLPNIFIMEPPRSRESDFSIYQEVISIVKNVTWNKTGRHHTKNSYDEIFDGTHNKKSGDIIVLLFSLDTKERIPCEYEDLLPRPWSEIEATLEEGKTMEVMGKERSLNVILLAAPLGRSLSNSSEIPSTLTI